MAPGSKDKVYLSRELQHNIEVLEETFLSSVNDALKIRELSFLQKEAVLIYIDVIVDTKVIADNIMIPLLSFLTKPASVEIKDDTQDRDEPEYDYGTLIIKHVLTASFTTKISTFQEVVTEILEGNTILLLEDYGHAISIDTAKFAARTVEEPKVEKSVKGSKEAFVESVDVNRSLIRKQLKDSRLITEVVKIGERAPSLVSVMYIQDLADPELVQKVKERTMQIKSDTVLNLDMLEEHIEDRSYSLIPSVLVTERPDRASAYLLEGHVILLMGNSPNALIAPITFWSLFQSGEDYYLRWPEGNFIRIIRLMAMFIAFFTPAIYVAASTFHVEMLPTDLMLAIAGTRERVPFPIIVEVFFMELTFEILREASTRIPTAMGATIGIVGALILGQAAVEANIISPILVVVVAITGLSSFAIPSISLNYAVRILRFGILIAATVMGFFGNALFFILILAYMSSIKSFEVPFFSPMAPHQRSSKDLILRPPVWKMWLRPFSVDPQEAIRRKKPGRK